MRPFMDAVDLAELECCTQQRISLDAMDYLDPDAPDVENLLAGHEYEYMTMDSMDYDERFYRCVDEDYEYAMVRVKFSWE
jgi:hypothetical protein